MPWLQSLQAQQLELRQYEHSPLVQVQSFSQLPRGATLFESLLVVENYPIDASLRQRTSFLDVREASAHFDMQVYASLVPGDIVRARRGNDLVTLLHPVGYNFFATLRQKLHWSLMPSESHSRG